MRLSKFFWGLALWPVVGCLALQDVPTRAAGEDCEADDWCQAGLLCLSSGNGSTRKCAKAGSCGRDADCAATELCDGADYSKPGTCKPNAGCTTNANCSSGFSCFRGVCYKFCSTSSTCGTDAYCLSLTSPTCPIVESNCPQVCTFL